MPVLVRPFTDEQARCVANLAQQYDVWLEAERAFSELPYNLVRKEIKGRAYLYELFDRAGNGRSLGSTAKQKVGWRIIKSGSPD